MQQKQEGSGSAKISQRVEDIQMVRSFQRTMFWCSTPTCDAFLDDLKFSIILTFNILMRFWMISNSRSF